MTAIMITEAPHFAGEASSTTPETIVQDHPLTGPSLATRPRPERAFRGGGGTTTPTGTIEQHAWEFGHDRPQKQWNGDNP